MLLSAVCYWVLQLHGCAGWGVSRASRSVRPASCSLSEARECCGFGQGDCLSAQCCRLRGASAWWCGTGGGSGPQRGRPDGVRAQSDSARFLAAGLEPAQWLPGSDEGKPKEKVTVNTMFKCGVYILYMLAYSAVTLSIVNLFARQKWRFFF